MWEDWSALWGTFTLSEIKKELRDSDVTAQTSAILHFSLHSLHFCLLACLQVTGIVLWANYFLSKTEKKTALLYLLQQSVVSAPSCKPFRDHIFEDAVITPLMDKSDTGLQRCWPLVGSLPTTWVIVTKTAESGWTLDGGGQTWHKTKEILTHHVYFWDRVDTGYVDAHSYDDWRT